MLKTQEASQSWWPLVAQSPIPQGRSDGRRVMEESPEQRHPECRVQPDGWEEGRCSPVSGTRPTASLGS